MILLFIMTPKEYRQKKFGKAHKPRYCWMCKCELSFATSTVDHLVPKSHGGKDKENNYRLACAPCNHERGNQGLSGRTIVELRGNPPPKKKHDFSKLAEAIKRNRPKV